MLIFYTFSYKIIQEINKKSFRKINCVISMDNLIKKKLILKIKIKSIE